MNNEPQKQRQEVRVKYTAGQSETGKTNKYRKSHNKIKQYKIKQETL